MPNNRENEAFVRHILSHYPLDDAIEWIKDNLSPDDVFDAGELFRWAERNASGVEDVFPVSDLADWAEQNGYKKD